MNPANISKITKKDVLFAIITGLGTALILIPYLKFIGVSTYVSDTFNIKLNFLIIIVPILWVFGIWLSYFIGRQISFFKTFGKFAATGFLSTLIDLGILNLLISSTGYTAGIYFSIFKTISFLVAFSNSFAWNKFWTFRAGNSGDSTTEIKKYFAVTLIGVLVNVGIASLVVNTINPFFGLSAQQWANASAITATIASMFWNFAGYKLVVFRNK